MKKKKVAWLLTAAMLATSVDGSALLVNGADFTSEAEEVQEASVESEASELDEAAEEGTEEVQEADSADESDAELALEDGAEELTEEENGGQENAQESEDQNEFSDGSTEGNFAADDASKLAIKSIKVETPKIAVWDGLLSSMVKWMLRKQLWVTVTYEDGAEETITYDEETSQGDSITADFSQVPLNEYGEAKLGTYIIPISVRDQKAEVEVTSAKIEDYYEKNAQELNWDKPLNLKMQGKYAKYYYKYVAPEDGKYVFPSNAGEDGPRCTAYQYYGTYLDESALGTSWAYELKKGDVLYLEFQNGAKPEFDYTISAVNRNHTLEKIELITPPKTEYARGIDLGFNDYLYEEYITLDGLKIRATYSDGQKKDFTGEDKTCDWMPVDIQYEKNGYDEVKKIIITLEGQTIEIPVKRVSFSKYFENLDKNTVEVLSQNEKKELAWKTANGYLYKVTPAKDGTYTFRTGMIDNESFEVTGYLMDENGNTLKQDSETTENFRLEGDLTAGKSYYFLLRAAEEHGAKNSLEFSCKHTIDQITLSKSDVYADTGIDDFEWNDNLFSDVNVKLKFTDGSEETVKCQDGVITKDGYKVEIISADNIGVAKDEESYTGTVRVGDKETPITVHVKPWHECYAKNGQELSADIETRVNTKEENANYYYVFTAPEKGKYTFKCEDYGIDIAHSMWIRTDGEDEYADDNLISVQMKKDQKVYLRIYSEGKSYGKLILTAGREDDKVKIETEVVYPDNQVSYIYTGEVIEPEIIVTSNGKTLKKGEDYQIVYQDNINAGEGSATISPVSDQLKFDTETVYYMIDAQEIQEKNCSVIPDQTYTGKPLTPAVKVTANGKELKAGVDYTLSYENNTNVGTATVTISGEGNYTGRITKQFKINRKVAGKIIYNLNGGKQNKNNKTTLNGKTIKLYNPTRKGYTFSGWYTDKNLKKKITSISSKTTTNVTLYAKWTKVSACKAPAKVTLKNSKAKTMAVSVSSVSGAKGYEISYATNAKFTKAVKKVQTGRTLSVTKLVKGKTYYVRVRAYKTDSTGAKVYGKYSKTVKLTLKK